MIDGHIDEGLKPCPFCGSKDLGVYDVWSENCNPFRYILCRTCGAKSMAFRTAAQAVRAWNRRVNNAESFD